MQVGWRTAIGPELKGKKIAISLSPDFFLETMTPPDVYAGNFSSLHAYGLAFNTELSWGLKQGVARRMLDYPGTLSKDRLLNFAVHELADGSTAGRLLYCAVLPLGGLGAWAMSLQDHWETIAFIRDQQNLDAAVVK